MSLTRDQRIALEIAGTVCVPSPSPALGEVRIVTDVEPGADDSAADLLARREIVIAIRHRVSARLMITRFVELHEVAALFLPDDPCAARFDLGTWILALELQADCHERVTRRPTDGGGDDVGRLFLGKGIVYLPEAARVLMKVEVGMTAAESVDYYPPLPGERGLDYHSFCDVEPES